MDAFAPLIGKQIIELMQAVNGGHEPGGYAINMTQFEVVLRESGRIRDAAVRLAELKSAFAGPGPASRAA